MNRIIIYGVFPPPYHGQSIGTRVLSDNLMKDNEVININISPQKLNENTISYYINYFRVYIKSLIQLWRIRNLKIDVFYFVPAIRPLSHYKDILILFLFSKKFQRIICHIRTGEFDRIFKNILTRKTAKFLVRKSSKLIFLSNHLEKMCSEHVPRSKRRVIFNFIDEDMICSSDTAIEYINERFKSNVIRVIYVSNLIETKGYKLLLDAFKEVHSDFDYFSLIVIGDGAQSDKEYVKKFIRKNNLMNSIVYVGNISDRRIIKKYYAESHIFVLPTYYPTEAQPRSIIEAMNFGIPIISTDHASIPEIIKDDYNGRVIPVKNKDSLINAIKSFSDKEILYRMSINARDTYERNHDYLKQIGRIKEELIK